MSKGIPYDLRLVPDVIKAIINVGKIAGKCLMGHKQLKNTFDVMGRTNFTPDSLALGERFKDF